MLFCLEPLKSADAEEKEGIQTDPGLQLLPYIRAAVGIQLVPAALAPLLHED